MDRELYQKFTWNTTYYTWLEEKNRSTESNFFQPFCCVLRSDTRQTDPFAVCQRRAHGKFNVHRMAVTGTPLCRVPHVRHTAKMSPLRYVFICCVLVCEAHSFLSFCRVPFSLPSASSVGTRQRLYLPCLLPCVSFAAHGKDSFCRMPDILYTTNYQAHGKRAFSGSGC